MENSCIYYRSEASKLTYEKQEHIIPAGIGGIMKLPRGYVSDQFNNDISKVELKFMRDSIIKLPRQIIGPGHRGKQGIKHATKSSVHLLEELDKNGEYSLGYIQLGKPHTLPQFIINLKTGEMNCSIPTGTDDSNAIGILLEALKNYHPDKVRTVTTEHPISNKVYIAFDKYIHVAQLKENDFILTQEIINAIINSITKTAVPPQNQSFLTKTNQIAVINDDLYRITAKTAFNTLAIIKGNQFVQNACFDPIRAYITYGVKEDFVQMIPKKEFLFPVPEDAHWVILGASGGIFTAQVCFYNHFLFRVQLSHTYNKNVDPDGFICDWKNQKESTLNQYLLNFNLGQEEATKHL